MSTLNGSAAEPQTSVDVPEVGGDTDNWGSILNGTTLQALLNYILWLYARVPSETVDTSGAQEGDTFRLQSGVWVAAEPAGGGAEALDDLSDVDTSGASDNDLFGLQSSVWGPIANTSDFATAAQGGLADTAVQPGDALTDLSSGAAISGQVPKADGSGGITWDDESGGGGGAAWGGITGTLSDQTDLQTALDAKLGKSATVQSYAGNRTLDASNNGAYIRITAAGTVTLPDGLSTGFQCVVVNATDAATVALSAATTLTIPTGFEAEVQNRRAVTVIHVGSNVWEVHGALVETP